MSSLSLPHTVIRFDIVGSSKGKRSRQMRLDDAFRTVIDNALADVPPKFETSAWYLRVDGDSGYLVVPASVPKAWLAADFVRQLEIQLRQHNQYASEATRLRLRMAIAHGDVVVRPPNINGSPVTEAARLVDSDALRATVTGSPKDDLFLVVTDRFYAEVIDEEDLDLDPRRFDKELITEKEYSGYAYIRRPGPAADGGSAPTTAPPSPISPPPTTNVVTANNGGMAAGRDIYNSRIK